MQDLDERNFLDEKILNPLLVSSGLTSEDQKVVRRVLTKIILTEVMVKALQALPKEKVEKVKQNVEGKSPEEQFKLLQEAIKDSPKAQKAIRDYFKKDLLDFIKKLLNTFLEKATSEQKEKFFTLSQLGE